MAKTDKQTPEQWRELATKESKGRSPEELVWETDLTSQIQFVADTAQNLIEDTRTPFAGTRNTHQHNEGRQQ